MRTDEAFKILKNAAWLGSDEEREAVEEAVTMACNALATIEQITWERDTAIEQLQSLGYGLGEEPRTDGDLISRQAAIDAILGVTIFDSERSLREYTQKTGSDKWCEGVIEAMDAVTEVPSVQPDLAQLLAYECGKASAQPEIIRCKDCKFTDGDRPIADGRYWCVLHGSFMYFCSDAERRTDEVRF